MTKIGYAAMLEQFHPTELLDWCERAETAGFSAGFMVSEHFHPWTPEQGNAAFAWSFMGALGQRTTLPFGVAVTCPGFRYHPAVVAHAAATLGAMYPGRFWLGLGAGEALNEHIVEAVNAGGDAYLTHTTLRGRRAMRIGVGNVLTAERHLEHAWRRICEEGVRLSRI